MNTKFNGILVFYINVGQLSSENAKIFIDSQKSDFNNDLRSKLLEKGYEIIFVPIRDGNTRVEVINLG